MDDLEILYNAMAKLAAKGKPFSEEQKQTVKETEDEYVMNKVLPAVEQALAGVINILQCPIDITINYAPGEDTRINYKRPHEKAEVKENVTEEDGSVVEEKKERKTKRKTVGFCVSFADGTVIHRMKAVDTWIDALKKIGLELICNNGGQHEAWHRVEDRDVCIVERTGVIRKDGHRPQNIVDGFYVMTQLSNEQKVKDLERLSQFQPQLGIKVTWDDDEQGEEVDSDEPIDYVEEGNSDYLVKSRIANGFALDVVKQLYNLDKLESVKPYFVRNQLTAVEKEGVFKLIGMFVRCSQEELTYRNTRGVSHRWYDTPFVVDGDTLYLSNQWVDKPFGALRISDLQKMVATCYHGLLEIQIQTNGLYVLKEK